MGRVSRYARLSGWLLPLICGCAGVGTLFNPEFLEQIGATSSAAALPGEAPAVLVEVENNTGHTIDYLLTYRDSTGVVQRPNVLGAGLKQGTALVCPVEEVTLGDVSNLDAVGAVVRLGNETPADPFIEVEPFGVLLRDGVNYDCGDVVNFTIQPSSASRSGYQVFAFIRRAGAQTP
jgi:hypothetical protein